MKLLTEELHRRIPPLYTTEELGADAVAQVKLFSTFGRCTWYGTEFDGEDTFFGFVESPITEEFNELGYFSLSDLETVKRSGIAVIERDLHFEPKPLREIPSARAHFERLELL